MDRRIQQYVTYVALLAAGFIGGYLYNRKNPDIRVNRPEYRSTLTLSSKELIERYDGKKELGDLLDIFTAEMVGEISVSTSSNRR